MKRTLYAVVLILLLSPCLAGAELASTPAAPIAPIAPTPSAGPTGAVFSGEDLTVTLPAGLEPMEDAELEGYAAAVQSDYPDAARIVLAAVDAEAGAAVSFSIAESAMDASTAAREAAERILGSADGVAEIQYGDHSCAAFACAIGEQTYTLYLLSDGARLLIVGTSGLEEAEIAAMLTGLRF